ncbi:diaminopimelate epimerase family protein [Mycobacterium kansasii 824]|nr:diaminopimelate epimerase family protein [Mycobacterium kansasii 824]
MMFAKGHGTENDFVLLPDIKAQLSLGTAQIAALCDRRRGLGADGVLRVTTAEAAAAAGVLDRLPDGVGAADWYMDYRNADGSVAQMCGNGVRVFAHYLRASGLERRTSSSSDHWPARGRSPYTASMRATPTSPSIWARPTGSARGPLSSGVGGFPDWPSTWATRTWHASIPG